MVAGGISSRRQPSIFCFLGPILYSIDRFVFVSIRLLVSSLFRLYSDLARFDSDLFGSLLFQPSELVHFSDFLPWKSYQCDVRIYFLFGSA